LGITLLRKSKLFYSNLHARFLSHEIHQNPNALVGINSVNRCHEISKASGEHFDTSPFAKTFWRQQRTSRVASEHEARDKLKGQLLQFAVKADKSRNTNSALDCAP
jgi:hypothetical protein